MSDAKEVIMKAEFVRRFFGNAHQTNSYPPSLVEELCVSHERLRAKLDIAREGITQIRNSTDLPPLEEYCEKILAQIQVGESEGTRTDET